MGVVKYGLILDMEYRKTVAVKMYTLTDVWPQATAPLMQCFLDACLFILFMHNNWQPLKMVGGALKYRKTNNKVCA